MVFRPNPDLEFLRRACKTVHAVEGDVDTYDLINKMFGGNGNLLANHLPVLKALAGPYGETIWKMLKVQHDIRGKAKDMG